MSMLRNALLNSSREQSRLGEAPKISPWNKFLDTLDTNRGLTESEVQTLFSKTLSKAPSTWKDSNDNTLLMHMASRGQLSIVKRLVHELYADVNAANKDGTTALHMAARGGFMNICAELMNSHADPCKKDRNGSTPAMIAQGQGHTAVAKFLSKEETEKLLWTNGAKFFGQQK